MEYSGIVIGLRGTRNLFCASPPNVTGTWICIYCHGQKSFLDEEIEVEWAMRLSSVAFLAWQGLDLKLSHN